VLAEQLRRLVEVGGLPTVEIRVMPFDAGLHHGVESGPFVKLGFPLNGNGQETEPPTVYVDSFTGALFLDKPREIERYDMAFTNIWQAALNEKDSRSLIEKTAKELDNE
jgi:hypothetical protein